MEREYWATCSIYDYTHPLFRKALLLFDRLVVPVPTRPAGTLTQNGVDELHRLGEQLVEHDAAVMVEWDPGQFDMWLLGKVAAEGLAAAQRRDLVYDTRLQMLEHALKVKDFGQLGSDPFVVPLYPSRVEYEFSTTLLPVEQALHLQVETLLPAPSDDVAIEDILRLRERDSFRQALTDFHQWRDEVLPAAAIDGDSAAIDRAVATYKKWLSRYEEEIERTRFNRIKTVVMSVLGVGAGVAAVVSGSGPLFAAAVAAAPGAAEALFSVREVRQPSWKQLASKEFAPAAVVYEGRQLFSK